MDLSFIIPAYNEASNIAETISAIKTHTPGRFQYEIIVVDHGSQDDTATLAKTGGATVFSRREGTVAGLRNYGVSHSTGSVLVFLDADIRLTPDWEMNIGLTERSLSASEPILTGSWCSIPDNPSWIEKFWFKPLERGDNTHINSGHLIISRHWFDKIGGFNENLETGEDYDISVRAKAAGLKLIDNTDLRVIHDGYPKNLAEFARREYWHGQGDGSSLAAFAQSKVAVVSLFFIALHFALLICIIYPNRSAMYALLACVAGIPFLSAIAKYRTEPVPTILVNSFVYYVYFWARGLAILSLSGLRNPKKRTR